MNLLQKLKIKTHDPYPHQILSANRAFETGHYAFLFQMGAGKSFATILTLRMLYNEAREIKRTLIFAPSVVINNWKEEFKLHSFIPHECIMVAHGTGKKREAMIAKNCVNQRIIVINYEALRNEKIYQMLLEWEPECLVLDESHKCKNYKAKTSKKVMHIADGVREVCGNVFILTGTAILNSIEDIYMQWRIMDGGETFGKNFFAFRGRYMVDTNQSWAGRANHYPDYQPREEMFSELHRKIQASSMRVTKEEVMPFLPPLIKVRREVEMSPEQKRMYKEMKDEFITFVQEKEKEGMKRAAVAQLALTKSLRLMQILSGFILDEEGEVYEIKKNPRLDAVAELLEELTPTNKVILWCSFKHNYKQLARVCESLGVKYVMIHGEVKAKDKAANVKSFQEDEDVRVAIANRGAGGIGVNLTAAAYSINYSRNFSLGEELQSEARNHRGGSEIHDKIIKIDLVVPGSLDETVLQALYSKQKISDIVIDAIKEEK